MLKIFSKILLLGALLSVSSAQAAPIQGPNGNYYERIDLGSTPALWSEARDEAALMSFQGESGHLATVLSSQTQDFIQQNLRNGAPANCWFGASDESVEGDWRWVTGELFWQGNAGGSVQNNLYENWAGGEPNDAGAGEDGAQWYSNGTWNDFFNTSRISCYFVEYPGVIHPVPFSPVAMILVALLLGSLGLRRLKARA